MEVMTMADGSESEVPSEALREVKQYWETQRQALEKRQREVLWESRLATVICVLSCIIAIIAMCIAWAHR
jgi:type IV secretory pathway component VirB8